MDQTELRVDLVEVLDLSSEFRVDLVEVLV